MDVSQLARDGQFNSQPCLKCVFPYFAHFVLPSIINQSKTSRIRKPLILALSGIETFNFTFAFWKILIFKKIIDQAKLAWFTFTAIFFSRQIDWTVSNLNSFLIHSLIKLKFTYILKLRKRIPKCAKPINRMCGSF